MSKTKFGRVNNKGLDAIFDIDPIEQKIKQAATPSADDANIDDALKFLDELEVETSTTTKQPSKISNEDKEFFNDLLKDDECPFEPDPPKQVPAQVQQQQVVVSTTQVNKQESLLAVDRIDYNEPYVPTNDISSVLTSVDTLKNQDSFIDASFKETFKTSTELLDTAKFLLNSSADPSPEAISAITNLVKASKEIVDSIANANNKKTEMIFKYQLEMAKINAKRDIEELKNKRGPQMIVSNGPVNIDQSHNQTANITTENNQQTIQYSQEDMVARLLAMRKAKNS